MADDEDVRLMLRFQQGDRGAFEELFRRYTPRLMSFLARMLKDHGRAEELAQEVFVRVYKARQRYEPRARFSTWIFGIAHNLALNELQRAGRKRERPIDDAVLAGQVDPAPGLEEQHDARQIAHQIQQALHGLPERQRAALLLRSEQGLSYAEIGHVLKASSASIKSLIRRARMGLLEQLKGTPS